MNMFDSIKFVYNIDDEMKNRISSIDLKLSKIKITSNQKRENLVIYLLINGNEINRKKIKENIQLEDFKYSLNKEILQKIYEAIDSNKSVTNIVDSMEEKELISQCTKIMADDYEISDIDKCIEDIINSYTKDKLIRKTK